MAQTLLRDYLQTIEDELNSGSINDALANCQNILTHFPDLLEAQRLLGEVYLAQGRLEDAQQTLDWVLTNDPENVIAYCSRALVSEHMSDYDTALDCYQQAYELSRGNSQIRQEFNQLSAKVGQQGFVFSRAGLARLYMRGDLLPQAIQEWETILALNPDRLDARTGLLETYWRAGLYDRVEQLAIQILDDVPDCLKALLLLAHVTFPQNALQAQELMRRARALDTDLIMAQELFSDSIINQPKDPFLTLLKKPPTVLPETFNGKQPISATLPEKTATGTNGASALADPLVQWSSLDNIIEPQQDYPTMPNTSSFETWANNGTRHPFDQQESQMVQELPTQVIHTQASNSTPDLDPFSWNSTFGQQEHQPAQEQPETAAPSKNDALAFDLWGPLDQHADALAPHKPEPVARQTPQAVQEVQEAQEFKELQEDENATVTRATRNQDSPEQEQPWYHMDTFTEPAVEPWSNVSPPEPNTTAAPWEVETKEGDLPAPPAWLDMLTKGERRQPSGGLPKQPAPVEQEPPAPVVNPVVVNPPTLEQAEPTLSIWTPPEEKKETTAATPAPTQPSDEDDEGFFFGPEWLKSLGATVMESSSSLEEETPVALAKPTSTEPTPSVLAEQPSPAVWTPPEPSRVSAPLSAPEPTQVSTPPLPEPTLSSTPQALFEETEDSAMVPPPPLVAETKPKTSVQSWLDQAAQRLANPGENVLTTLEELERDLRSQGFMTLEPGSLSTIAQEKLQEPNLASALAQFGDITPQPQSTDEAYPAPAQQPQPVTQPAVSPAEPLWATPTSAVEPEPEPVSSMAPPPHKASSAPSHLEALSSYISKPAAMLASTSVPGPATKPSSATPEPVHMDALASLVSNAVPSPTLNIQAAPATPTPTMPFDSELETTMKRPAVRMQPVQQRPSVPASPPAVGSQPGQPIPKGRSSEHPAAGKAPEGKSYKERLLKGYQHQLAGTYDEAMQEYRIIIRNAPDLLGEVVSNLRALLKLAPKYSAGYRVLGDAYMRQGEYLQAMEAYNKALTMAKKAKG